MLVSMSKDRLSLGGIPIKVVGEDYSRPISIWGAIQQLTQQDLEYLAVHIFARPKSHWNLLMAEALVIQALEVSQLEKHESGATLVWLDPDGIVKVPVWPKQ